MAQSNKTTQEQQKQAGVKTQLFLKRQYQHQTTIAMNSNCHLFSSFSH